MSSQPPLWSSALATTARTISRLTCWRIMLEMTTAIDLRAINWANFSWAGVILSQFFHWVVTLHCRKLHFPCRSRLPHSFLYRTECLNRSPSDGISTFGIFEWLRGGLYNGKVLKNIRFQINIFWMIELSKWRIPPIPQQPTDIVLVVNNYTCRCIVRKLNKYFGSDYSIQVCMIVDTLETETATLQTTITWTCHRNV